MRLRALPARKPPPLQVGVDLSGHALLLKDFRAQALLGNFWASWCEPCREEVPSLTLLSDRRSGELRVLAGELQIVCGECRPVCGGKRHEPHCAARPRRRFG